MSKSHQHEPFSGSVSPFRWLLEAMMDLLIENYEPLEMALGDLLDAAVTGSQDLQPLVLSAAQRGARKPFGGYREAATWPSHRPLGHTSSHAQNTMY